MTEEEIKSAIADAVAEATKGLKDKNTELLGKVKKLETDNSTLAQTAEEAAEEAARKGGDLEALEKSLAAKWDKERKALEGARDAHAAQLKELLIENTIKKALVDNNVAAHMHEPLTFMFRHGTDIKDGAAVRDGAELGAFLTDYFGSDTGKHYVQAPANSGGGATGGAKSIEGGVNYKKADGSLDHTKFGELIKSDRAEAKRWASENGFGNVAKEL